MNWFSKMFLLAALWIFAFMCFLTIARGQKPIVIRPKVHMALTDPGHNGVTLLEIWCEQLTVGHDDEAVYCWHNGVAVIKVPHNAPFSWAPLEAK